MSVLHAINPAYVLSGFLVGFLVGMTGVGGGSLMTPLLILLFGISPEKAVATDLIYASVTKTGGSLVHAINKTIDWRIVLRLASGSLPACLATLVALHFLGLDSAAANARDHEGARRHADVHGRCADLPSLVCWTHMSVASARSAPPTRRGSRC